MPCHYRTDGTRSPGMGDAARSAACAGPNARPEQSDAHAIAGQRPLTDWKLAMLAILPFVVAHSLPHTWQETRDWLLHARFRTWAVLFIASMASLFVPVEASFTDMAQNVRLAAWYIAIDGIAAALIIPGSTRNGACFGQFFIGLFATGMVMFHAGFILAANPATVGEWLFMQASVGWLQFAMLLAWGMGDVGGTVYRWWRGVDRAPAHNNGS